MKVTYLKIKNIGKLAAVNLTLDKPLILLYGEIRQGKSTILNCVRWVCGGEFPTDIIKHDEEEASIELGIDGGAVMRSFYRAKDKDKTVKARPVIFVKNGKPVPSPVAEIKRLLNPFLLDQDFLRNKTELERKQYFAEIFAVDTTALDTELFNSQRDAQNLRSKIDGYGKIELVPVEPVDTTDLQGKLRRMKAGYASEKAELESQLQKLGDDHQAELDAINLANDKLRSHNAEYDRSVKAGEDLTKEIERFKKQLEDKVALWKENQAWLNNNPKSELKPLPSAPDRTPIQKAILDLTPDTSTLEKQIQDAGATNVRAEQFQKDKKRAGEKEADEKSLREKEKRQRDIKAEKQAKLKEVSATCGVPGLEFDEEGNFMYEGTTAGMISDSQLMKLSNALSNLFPDGFDVSLLDRAESLGKSIFEYVERAKKQKKTILATIVGERPAKVPPEIGVFVVQEGKVSH